MQGSPPMGPPGEGEFNYGYNQPPGGNYQYYNEGHNSSYRGSWRGGRGRGRGRGKFNKGVCLIQSPLALAAHNLMFLKQII